MSEYFTGNFQYPEWYLKIPDGTSLKTREVAMRLGTTSTNVIRWIKRGLLKAIQPTGSGGSYYISKESLGEFLKDKTALPDRFYKLKNTLNSLDKASTQEKQKNQNVSFSHKKFNELKEVIRSEIKSLEENLSSQIKMLEDKMEVLARQSNLEPKKSQSQKNKHQPTIKNIDFLFPDEEMPVKIGNKCRNQWKNVVKKSI